MFKKILYMGIVALLLIGIVSGYSLSKNGNDKSYKPVHDSIQAFENLYTQFMGESLPSSLDKYYKGSTPEVPSSEYVGEMFIQAGAFDGMVANLQEGDVANATVQYKVFASEYKNISKKVPEWSRYFDIATVNKLGNDLKRKNVSAAIAYSFNDIGIIGKTCSKCHEDNQPQVLAKYYWRDFDTVNVSTSHGNLTWVQAMEAMAGSYEGIGVDAQKGNWAQANVNFNQFNELFHDVKDACKNCHDTPRLYYVSDDVMSQVEQLGANVTAMNLPAVLAEQQGLGIQCYRCHALHMPAQDMKAKMVSPN
jgi:cytochrome c556